MLFGLVEHRIAIAPKAPSSESICPHHLFIAHPSICRCRRQLSTAFLNQSPTLQSAASVCPKPFVFPIPINVHLLKTFSTVKCTTNKANIYCFINVVLVVVKINHQNHKRRPLMKAFFLAFFALSCGVSLNSDFYTKWIDSKLFMAFNRRGALS